MTYRLQNDLVDLTIHLVKDDKIHLVGKISNPKQYQDKFIIAANPIDRMLNYSGSGLPFPCPSIAFEQTPNYFKIPDDGSIDTTFTYPNSYYIMETHKKVVPSVFITLKNKNEEPIYYQMPLEDKLPLKTTVTYRPEHKLGPEFYDRKEIAMGIPPSQEWILRNIGDYKARYGFA